MPMTSNIKRRIGGAIAKANGRQFESQIMSGAFNSGAKLIRIHDGARRVGPRKLIPVAQPFDFAGVLSSGRAIFFDAKSCGDKKSSFSARDYSSSMDQLRELLRMEHAGAVAGFVVWSERCDATLFLHASNAQERIKWDDPRWVVLGRGAIAPDFRKLDTPTAA